MSTIAELVRMQAQRNMALLASIANRAGRSLTPAQAEKVIRDLGALGSVEHVAVGSASGATGLAVHAVTDRVINGVEAETQETHGSEDSRQLAAELETERHLKVTLNQIERDAMS